MDCVVADAVAVEPVSTPKFPANREKNREFCKIAASRAADTINNAIITELSVQIPYSAEQGIILTEHGFLVREQGILSTGVGNIIRYPQFYQWQSLSKWFDFATRNHIGTSLTFSRRDRTRSYAADRLDQQWAATGPAAHSERQAGR